MAITNYTELRSAIIDWSFRDDLDLKIDDFISIAETYMLSNESENLKIRDFETLTTNVLSIVSRFNALPSGYQNMRSISLLRADGSRKKLEYRTPQALHLKTSAQEPDFYTITTQIEFDAIPLVADTIEIQYFADFTPLTAVNPTNSVLTKSHNIYLFGALWALFTYIDDDAKTSKYKLFFKEAIRGANSTDIDGRYGPGLTMVNEGPTP